MAIKLRVKSFKYLLFILSVCVPLGVLAQELDINLLLRDDGEDISIAVKSAGSTSPLIIHKNGINYGIELVDPSHPLATNMRINTPHDGIKAIKQYALGPVTFHAAHSPLYYPSSSGAGILRANNPDYLCNVDEMCTRTMCGNGSMGCSNGIFPREISSKAMYNPGDKLKIVKPSGVVCPRVESASPYCWSKSRCCRNCPGVPCDVPTHSFGSEKIKIGFYRTNQVSSTNVPIVEYKLSDFLVGNGIAIPAGTNYIYVYFIDSEGHYADNSYQHKISFYYRIKRN